MKCLTNEVKRTIIPIRQDSEADSFHAGGSASNEGTAHAHPVACGCSALLVGSRNRGCALAIASPAFSAAVNARLTYRLTSRRKRFGGPEALRPLDVKASLVSCAVMVAVLTAILASATVARGENRNYVQSATGTSMVTVAPDGQADEAAAALERLARANFGELSEAEVKLVHAAPRRALLWVGPNSDADSLDNDPTHAAKWLPTRAIRGALIGWLTADPQARPYIHPSGVGFGGAFITGRLDLSYLALSSPLTIMSSAIPQGVDFSFAHLHGLDLSRDVTGPVLGDRSTVEGDVILTGGNYGPTSLFRIEIDGSLDCSGGQFLGGEDALSVVEATIRDDASFHQGFTTNGVVDLRLAQIGRGLSFNHARFIGSGENGLTAERSTINETLYWVDITHTPRTELDLNNAHVGSLWDDSSSWPGPGRLFVDGFVYGAISGGPADAPSRLKWLARQPSGYWPQTYAQLARVLRDRDSNGAVDVMIADQNAHRRESGLGWGERVWRGMLDATIGYGYRPMRALWWILSFVVLGAMMFAWGYRERAITPTDPAAYGGFVQSGELPRHYPPFNAVIYSLENFLPLVDLHQGQYWRPNPRHGSGGRLPALSGTLLRWYLWVHILAGWILTPLLAAGLSGLVRPG